MPATCDRFLRCRGRVLPGSSNDRVGRHGADENANAAWPSARATARARGTQSFGASASAAPPIHAGTSHGFRADHLLICPRTALAVIIPTMAAPSKRNRQAPSGDGGAEDDSRLLDRLVRGDERALAALLDRYDRLVRFAIFRTARAECARDPQWLDGVASATWMGFVQTTRRRGIGGIRSLRVYLIQIARNQALTARRGTTKIDTVGLDQALESGEPVVEGDVAEALDRWIDLTALNECIEMLPADDRTLLGQVLAISDRRWRKAADALGLAESTLRSRWKNLLEKLRRCMMRNRPEGLFAPEASPIDSFEGGSRENP